MLVIREFFSPSPSTSPLSNSELIRKVTVRYRLSTASFSEDSSIMAAGFGESYIRLWSLTGKGLKQLRTDLKGDEVSKVNDGTLSTLCYKVVLAPS